MHTSNTLFLAALSVNVANIIAAPAGLSPNIRPVSPSQPLPTPATPTTSEPKLATMTPAPVQKRQARGDINMLEDFVFPQKKVSSSSAAASSSTFAFVITRPTPPAVLPAPVQKRQARGDINMLEDFVFPQKKVSSSSAAASSSTFAFVITRPTPPAAAPGRLGGRDVLPQAAPNDDNAFGPLEELVFPQKVSSSSGTASPSATPELSPSRHPLAAPIDANP
ncbi:MAG: hypothetical protein Q9169_000713 [Polycauliona sp. 2 TL-2023]